LTFEDLKITRQFLNALDDAGFTTPTPIQAKAIPMLKSGKDVIGIAQTGTGKTAAYLLPLLMKIKYADGMHPRALILVPSRELALQVEEQIGQLATYTDLRFVGVYGGIGLTKQGEKLEKGVDILVGTPGRFIDLYKNGFIETKHIKTLVIDEADRLLDLGFLPQLNAILEVIPTKRQNLLFSATFSERVEQMTHDFLEWPEKIEVAEQATPVETVKASHYKVPNLRTKISLLEHLLDDPEKTSRVIVFTRTRQSATNVFKYVQRKMEGEVRLLHANKEQTTRINSINAFKSGEVRVLVATDVAARGTDVFQVSHVINFEVPVVADDYVHRIGRTGRAGHTGTAVTLVAPNEEWYLAKIEGLIRQSIPEEKFPKAVEVHETPPWEAKDMAREVDKQRRKDDPTYQGAFHERKKKTGGAKKKGYKKRRK